jgi:ribosome silencing factor RsfS/YbeB/iojap
VLELGRESSIADYLVLANGMSRPQVKALYNELHARLKAAGERHSRAEGTELGWWILMDYGDVIVHLMQPEARDHYDLDGLYREAREIDWRKLELPPLPLPKARLRSTKDAGEGELAATRSVHAELESAPDSRAAAAD